MLYSFVCLFDDELAHSVDTTVGGRTPSSVEICARVCMFAGCFWSGGESEVWKHTLLRDENDHGRTERSHAARNALTSAHLIYKFDASFCSSDAKLIFFSLKPNCT